MIDQQIETPVPEAEQPERKNDKIMGAVFGLTADMFWKPGAERSFDQILIDTAEAAQVSAATLNVSADDLFAAALRQYHATKAFEVTNRVDLLKAMATGGMQTQDPQQRQDTFDNHYNEQKVRTNQTLTDVLGNQLLSRKLTPGASQTITKFIAPRPTNAPTS